MKNKSCLICNNKNLKIIWNDKIRSGINKFTKKKEVVIECNKCNLVFLKNLRKNLENSAVARALYNNDNSIREFLRFHKPRELKKLNYFERFINTRNKRILESNCGAGVLLSLLKNKAKKTSGIDDKIYKNYLLKNNHDYFGSFDEAIKKKKKFDLILSLSELEHKFNPINFLKMIKKVLSKKGKIVIRVPNYKNIYAMLLGNDFYKYDFRTSHNYYFSENNLDLLFTKVGFNIEHKLGMQEYDFNHTLKYIKTRKRVSEDPPKLLSHSINMRVKRNIENTFVSTSLVYILSVIK